MIWPHILSKWLKKPAPKPNLEDFETARDRYMALARDGWKLAQYEPPIGEGEVVFTYNGVGTFIMRWDRFPREQNVAGLWWRPLGETIDVTPECDHEWFGERYNRLSCRKCGIFATEFMESKFLDVTS